MTRWLKRCQLPAPWLHWQFCPSCSNWWPATGIAAPEQAPTVDQESCDWHWCSLRHFQPWGKQAALDVRCRGMELSAPSTQEKGKEKPAVASPSAPLWLLWSVTRLMSRDLGEWGLLCDWESWSSTSWMVKLDCGVSVPCPNPGFVHLVVCKNIGGY